MATSARDFIASLPRERQEKIQARFEELDKEYMALQDVRKAMDYTQEQLATELNIGQGALSKIEKRSDLMISTLRRYIEAMGGSLKIVAEFPEKPPIEVKGFGKNLET